MPDNNHVTDLLPAYALDSLDEDEAVQVSEHLSDCTECQSELYAFQAVAAQLSLTGPVSDPPPDLKRQLFDRVQKPLPTAETPVQKPQEPWIPRLLSAWSVVSLVLILALGLGSVYLWQRIIRLEESNRPGGMYAFSLIGTEKIPDAAGFLIIGADGRNGAIIVDKLPPLDPETEEYQLWLIRDGEHTSGALLAVDEMGYGGRRVSAPDNLLTYSAVRMTIEPVGGSHNPTGEVVLVGTLTSP